MIKTFLISLIAFVVFDGLWLGVIMKDFNMRKLSEIARIQDGKFDIQYAPAVIAYLLMAIAVSVFVIPLLGEQTSAISWFLTGAIMGLVIYGIYDMSNSAILKNYPLSFAIADIAWGTFVFGLVTVIVKKFA